MRIGVLTSGGDAPGLNAVIRAVVRRANRSRHSTVGFRHGWRGVVDCDVLELNHATTAGILHRGGTILGTSRATPFNLDDGVERALDTLDREGVDALIVVGGEGSLACASRMSKEHGIAVVGVPKTIDNDVRGTDVTFGFDTAVMIATEAIDRLHSTAESHDRVIVVEVMGRHAGWIATYSGVAGGADIILVPERPFDITEVCRRLTHRHRRGSTFSIVVVAEGAIPLAGTMPEHQPTFDRFGHEILGGIAERIRSEIEGRTGYEARTTILGHTQRGGTPTAADRLLASRFGVAAAEAAIDGENFVMVALRGTEIIRVPLDDAAGGPRCVPPDLLDTAEVFSC
jgi:phosphofructokinase-like protein